MQFNRRRVTAFLLILLGLIAFLFGLWIIISLFWNPAEPSAPNLPQAGTDLTVTPREVVPQVYSVPSVVEGPSTVTANDKGSDLTEAQNRASVVVARMGSGSSKTGFLGYQDVMLDATPSFQNNLLQLQTQAKQAHPADGPVYGVTTRVISANIQAGENGSDVIMVKVQSQKAEDTGDRGNPTSVTYEEHLVTLVRQPDGVFLVDAITTKPIEQ